jgi:cell division protein FtsQ
MRSAIGARKTAERNEIRRFTAHVRRRRQAALAIVACVTGLTAFVAVGTFSPVMALRTVTVDGTQRVDPELIVAGVTPQLGTPLPLVDANAIRDVIALQPLVKSFAIEAKPPHELVIHISERVPAGYLSGASGFTLVDPAGVTIEKTPERTLPLPVIDVKGASSTARGFPAAMAVLSALPGAVRSQVDRVSATTTDDVTLFLNPTGSRVIWGGPENSALKARVLSALIANYPLGSVSTYDVSAPTSAVVS